MGILFEALFLILVIFLFAVSFKLRFQSGRRRNSGRNQREANASAGRKTETVELVKDEVCGRFVLKEVSQEWMKDGIRHYFCCEECRKRYMEANVFQ